MEDEWRDRSFRKSVRKRMVPIMHRPGPAFEKTGGPDFLDPDGTAALRRGPAAVAGEVAHLMSQQRADRDRLIHLVINASVTGPAQ